MLQGSAQANNGKVTQPSVNSGGNGRIEEPVVSSNGSHRFDRTQAYRLFEIKGIDLKSFQKFNTGIVSQISEDTCRFYRLVPLDVSDNQVLRIAMADPFNMAAVEIIRNKTGLTVESLHAPDEDIEITINRIYSKKADFEQTLQELVELEVETDSLSEEREDVDILRSSANDAPAVKFVNTLLVQAIQERASDVHLEPQEKSLNVRLRVDGQLRDLPPAPRRLQSGIITRMKILGSLDIAERRVPQDGRAKIRVMGRSVDLRISTLPTIYGEKIVLRLLDKGSISLNIDDLGIDPDFLPAFKDNLSQSQGMIIVTGPTGSGKTTTLYSALNYVNKPESNIVTIEDPVEFRLPGINQVQSRSKVGLTFAAGLRSILRQDPDIIMIGEIRDFETAETAVKAALTGHLVFSTLHTNNAVATILRLVNMGVDKYLIASALALIIAQRLARRICLNCRESTTIPDDVREKLERDGINTADLSSLSGAGCSHCSGTGFWGRVAIHEILFMTSELKDLILRDAAEKDIRQTATAGGMHTLLDDGIRKAKLGLTTFSEVYRVI